LLAAAKLLLFQADLFVLGWLIITPRSHASRNREEPESFNADAHRLTFAPRVFFLEVVRVDWEHRGPSRELVPSRPGGAVRGRHHRADLLVAVASCDRRQNFTRPCGCTIHGAGRPGEGLEVLAEHPGARREGSTSFNHALCNHAFKRWTWQGLIAIKRGGTRDEKRER
jgi:hypothetical protein